MLTRTQTFTQGVANMFMSMASVVIGAFAHIAAERTVDQRVARPGRQSTRAAGRGCRDVHIYAEPEARVDIMMQLAGVKR